MSTESQVFVERAEASAVGVILMVIVTILLAVAVLLALQYPTILLEATNTTTPLVLKITSAISTEPDYKSILLLTNIDTKSFENDDYYAEIFRNGEQMNCVIQTLNARNFISTCHTGVQTISGPGCIGGPWNVGAQGKFDLSDRSFRPGDTIRVDIYDTSSKTLFSRDTIVA